MKNYPWEKTKKGQGFFVPALDLHAVRIEGLSRAHELRIFRAKAIFCIKDGKLGVWFYR